MQEHSPHIVGDRSIYCPCLERCITLHRRGKAYDLYGHREEALLFCDGYREIVDRGHHTDGEMSLVGGILTLLGTGLREEECPSDEGKTKTQP